MISQTGYWSVQEYHTHKTSENLAKFLASYLDKTSPVIDFGCGNGYYLSHLHKEGFTDLTGIDGFKPKNAFFEGIEELDLTKPIFLATRGQVISLEVGEHIPADYEEEFLENITVNCNSKLVMSWAIKGQPGIGHVNCQNNDYIIDQITKRGFTYNEELSKQVRKSIEEETYWFRNTLMIFNKI